MCGHGDAERGGGVGWRKAPDRCRYENTTLVMEFRHIYKNTVLSSESSLTAELMSLLCNKLALCLTVFSLKCPIKTLPTYITAFKCRLYPWVGLTGQLALISPPAVKRKPERLPGVFFLSLPSYLSATVFSKPMSMRERPWF